jgi:FkbM family methyltransferase
MRPKPKQIYTKIKEKQISIEHACEVGVYLPETSNVLDFAFDGVRTTLVEPEPKSIAAIEEYFEGMANIKLHKVAVYERNGKLSLSKAESSTFATELEASPALVNDKYVRKEENNIEVDCVRFSEIDDKTIDLLSIDTEGCEWYVLSDLQSRPKVISVETHGKYYTNPFIKKIESWMLENGYKVWFMDKSDTVYVLNNLFELTTSDKASLTIVKAKNKLKKMKKILK